jgi:hypothetical protein
MSSARTATISILLSASAYAANPLLDANNEEDNDAAAKRISTVDKPPEFEPNDIYGIISGTFEHHEGSGRRESR